MPVHKPRIVKRKQPFRAVPPVRKPVEVFRDAQGNLHVKPKKKVA